MYTAKNGEEFEIEWRPDCGGKMDYDFDDGIIDIGCRMYPDAMGYVHVNLLGGKLLDTEIQAESMIKVMAEAEDISHKYLEKYSGIKKKIFSQIKHEFNFELEG